MSVISLCPIIIGREMIIMILLSANGGGEKEIIDPYSSVGYDFLWSFMPFMYYNY